MNRRSFIGRTIAGALSLFGIGAIKAAEPIEDIPNLSGHLQRLFDPFGTESITYVLKFANTPANDLSGLVCWTLKLLHKKTMDKEYQSIKVECEDCHRPIYRPALLTPVKKVRFGKRIYRLCPSRLQTATDGNVHTIEWEAKLTEITNGASKA